jgi:hypothetical protein
VSLDPRTNLDLRYEKLADKNEVEPLNPPFPYRKIHLDPVDFGLEREVDREGEET